jgi:hypothetical protein
MKRSVLIVSLSVLGLGSAWVSAQPRPRNQDESRAPSNQEPRPAPSARNGDMRGRMGPGGMMGMGPAGMGAGMMCPMVLGPDTRVQVRNLDRGVTVTLTSEDAATVVRLQKMAEATRLMHEAMTE